MDLLPKSNTSLSWLVHDIGIDPLQHLRNRCVYFGVRFRVLHDTLSDWDPLWVVRSQQSGTTVLHGCCKFSTQIIGVCYSCVHPVSASRDVLVRSIPGKEDALSRAGPRLGNSNVRTPYGTYQYLVDFDLVLSLEAIEYGIDGFFQTQFLRRLYRVEGCNELSIGPPHLVR